MKQLIFYIWLFINPFLVRRVCKRFVTSYWQFWITRLFLSITTAIAIPILVFKVDFPRWLFFGFIAWPAIIFNAEEKKYKKSERKEEKELRVGKGKIDDFFAKKIMPRKERRIRKRLAHLLEKNEELIAVGRANCKDPKKVSFFSRRCLIGITNKRALVFLYKQGIFRDQKIFSFPLEKINSCKPEAYEVSGKIYGWSFSTNDGVKHTFRFEKGFYEEHFIPKLNNSLKELLEKR